jgi:superfamily II DNA or RNA helicase|tara:strand:- start:5432 stop:6769 length:1338 start_codon:yes stop_codon:yes gene_type:complete
MKTLFPAQAAHADVIYRALRHKRGALDTSETGTGKTVMSAAIAQHWANTRGPVGVVCPKAVIPSWERELAEWGIKPAFVLNYEKLKNARDGIVRIKRKTKRKSKTTKLFEWTCDPTTLLIFDEVAVCKGAFTQNDQLLVAARNGNFHTLCLSATAAQDPTEMRALGYVLGLHDLNAKHNNNSWFQWMYKNGCYKDEWESWQHKPKHSLATLNDTMFNQDKIAHGITTSDLPGAFRNNRVDVDRLSFDGASKVYDECGLTKASVDQLMDGIKDKASKDSPMVLTEILRARQLVEAIKVPHFIDMTNDLVAQGKSVVVFFNFRESVHAFRKSFPDSGVVIGEQGAGERQQHIDDFQANKTGVIVVTAAAGGTGLSLHDTNGNHPRFCLISPTFSVQQHVQVLGRAYRAGGKSDVVQKIMVAAGSIEEYVLKKCEEKAATMRELIKGG